MSENAGFDVAGAAAGDNQPQGTENAPVADGAENNPAWNDLLTLIPGQLHEAVKPHLSKWDKGVQDRFRQVHSEYEPYKPFKEQGVDAETLTNAYQLYQAFNANPQAVYEGMQQHFGFGKQPEQGQEETDNGQEAEDGTFDLTKDPRFQELAQSQQQIQQFLEQKAQEEAAAAADSELDTALKDAEAKVGGPLDNATMKYILNVANARFTENSKGGLKGAVLAATEDYLNLRNGIAATPRPGQLAPQITPAAGGGVPVNNQNPAELGAQDRKALGAARLAQMLRDA